MAIIPPASLLNFQSGIIGRIAEFGKGTIASPIYTYGRRGNVDATGILFNIDVSEVINKLQHHQIDLESRLKVAAQKAGEAALDYVWPRIPKETGALVNSGRVYETALGDTTVWNIEPDSLKRTSDYFDYRLRTEGVTDAGVIPQTGQEMRAWGVEDDNLFFLNKFQQKDMAALADAPVTTGIHDVNIGWETSYAIYVYHSTSARHGADVGKPATERALWMRTPGGDIDEGLRRRIMSVFEEAVVDSFRNIDSATGAAPRSALSEAGYRLWQWRHGVGTQEEARAAARTLAAYRKAKYAKRGRPAKPQPREIVIPQLPKRPPRKSTITSSSATKPASSKAPPAQKPTRAPKPAPSKAPPAQKPARPQKPASEKKPPVQKTTRVTTSKQPRGMTTAQWFGLSPTQWKALPPHKKKEYEWMRNQKQGR